MRVWINVTTEQGELVERIPVEQGSDLQRAMPRNLLTEDVVEAVERARRIQTHGTNWPGSR